MVIRSILSITADDYGYTAAYDRGIVEAAVAGAVDGVSVMATRRPDPEPLLETGVALGLHLEPWPSPVEQAAGFERLVGRKPEHIDGHHHCHAAAEIAGDVAELGAQLGVPVRAVDDAHRRLLREHGAATAGRLLGRLDEDEPAMPAELGAWLAGGEALPGVTEWVVHPGHPDPIAGSRYDRGRAADLELLLELGDVGRWARRGIRRSSLARALSA